MWVTISPTYGIDWTEAAESIKPMAAKRKLRVSSLVMFRNPTIKPRRANTQATQVNWVTMAAITAITKPTIKAYFPKLDSD